MGSMVNIISKSGGKDFHGIASYYKRHEEFNANDFFNNRNGLVKPRPPRLDASFSLGYSSAHPRPMTEQTGWFTKALQFRALFSAPSGCPAVSTTGPTDVTPG